MQCNLDAIFTVRDAAIWFTHMRANGKPVTTHAVRGWIKRSELVKRDGGYRYGDLVRAEARARNSDKGAGRGRPKAALEAA